MSQRPPASRPASRSPPDGQKIALPPVQLRDEPQQGGRQVGRQQADQSEDRGYSQIFPSPRSTRTSLGEEWRSGPSRDFGVYSILNPTEPESTPSSSRRVSVVNAESPLSAVGPASHFGASPIAGTPHTFQGHETLSGTPPTQEGHHATSPQNRGTPAPRRILTPRSLATRMGRAAQPPGTIDTQRSPFLTHRGRTYTGESGQAASSGRAPMPTPPERSQPQFGLPEPTQTLDRRTRSMPTMQAAERAPLSQSASPIISTSANTPSSQPSMSSFHYQGGPPPPTSTSYYPGSSFGAQTAQQAGGGLQYQAPSASATEGPYSRAPPSVSTGSTGGSASASSSRQTPGSDPIQVLTITTSEGSYHVPVDVHQASRLADEKRARNAGASARFRQRRKEKEKEANTTIEKMQQQNRELERRVREVEQERDFYRGERDRMRDVLYRTPETRHMAMQGPPSPQSMRAGSFHGQPLPSQVHGPPQPLSFQPQESAPPERAPRRRRTGASGEFTNITYTLPPASTLPPVQPGFPGQGPTSLPPLRIENTAAPPPTTGANTPTSSAGPPPPPFDPFSRGPYAKGWPGEGSRR